MNNIVPLHPNPPIFPVQYPTRVYQHGSVFELRNGLDVFVLPGSLASTLRATLATLDRERSWPCELTEIAVAPLLSVFTFSDSVVVHYGSKHGMAQTIEIEAGDLKGVVEGLGR